MLDLIKVSLVLRENMLGNSYNVFRQAPVQSPGYANSTNRTAYLIQKKCKKNIFFCHCVKNKFIVL